MLYIPIPSISSGIVTSPVPRVQSGWGLRQWEMALHCNIISRWPNPKPECHQRANEHTVNIGVNELHKYIDNRQHNHNRDVNSAMFIFHDSYDICIWGLWTRSQHWKNCDHILFASRGHICIRLVQMMVSRLILLFKRKQFGYENDIREVNYLLYSNCYQYILVQEIARCMSENVFL